MAMIHDSVVLYAKAVDELLKSHELEPKPLSCDENENWEHGYSIINYMKVVNMQYILKLRVSGHYKMKVLFISNFVKHLMNF